MLYHWQDSLFRLQLSPPSLSLCVAYNVSLQTQTWHINTKPCFAEKQATVAPCFSLFVCVCFRATVAHYCLVFLSLRVLLSLSLFVLTSAIGIWHYQLRTHAFCHVHYQLTPHVRLSHYCMPAAVGITNRAHCSPATLTCIPFRNVAQVLSSFAPLRTLARTLTPPYTEKTRRLIIYKGACNVNQ